jgi:hypothetical protein
VGCHIKHQPETPSLKKTHNRYDTSALYSTIRPALTLDPAADDPARPWEPLFTDLDAGHGLTFSAWRRAGGPGPGGTEYRMAGLQAGCTAEEATDFFLDDAHRMSWDTLLAGHALLETGPAPSSSSSFHPRAQVVVWTRKFKVPLLGPREYVLARRAWREGEAAIAAVMVGQETHPAAPEPLTPGAVRIPAMWSAWVSRTLAPGEAGHPGAGAADAVAAWVPGGARAAAAAPATLTVMVRREGYGMPDALARPVVRKELPLYAERMGRGYAAFAADRAKRKGLTTLGSVDESAFCKQGPGGGEAERASEE